MSYKFKVGDEGLFRNGEHRYKVIAVDVPDIYNNDELAIVGIYWHLMASSPLGTPFTRLANGKHPGATEHSRWLDMIPPKRKVWRVSMRYANPVSSSLGWTHDYDNGSKAGNVFASLDRSKKTGDVLTIQEVEIDHE